MSKLWIKLRNKAYRHAFVATQLKRSIPFQFRVTRKKLGLSQADVARLAGVSQGVVSRAEDSDYGNLTFNNVLRIAAGLDVAFVGRLVPFSDLVGWFDNLSEESATVPTFEEEDRAFEKSGTTVGEPLEAAEARQRAEEALKQLTKENQILKLAIPLEDEVSNRIDEALKYLAMEDGFTLNGLARLFVDCQRRMAADWSEIGNVRRSTKQAEEARAQLEQYVQHQDGCEAWPQLTSHFQQATKVGQCTCGLAALVPARLPQEP